MGLFWSRSNKMEAMVKALKDAGTYLGSAKD